MANTYSWDCKTVDCYPTYEDNSDVVYNVHWRLNCTSDKLNAEGTPYSATVYGTQTISTADIKDFIPFKDLTNTTVVGSVDATATTGKGYTVTTTGTTTTTTVSTPASTPTSSGY